jgi:ribosomal protein L30/L7E
MDENGFEKFLRSRGKKTHVVNGLVNQVRHFNKFLEETGKTSIDRASSLDLQKYADLLEESKQGGSKMLRAVGLYYQFSGNQDLAVDAMNIREKATAKTRKIFKIKDFRGINPDQIARLESLGITNVNEMLVAGKTPQMRESLAEKSGIPLGNILELVKLSDLTRLGAIKSVRARLYYEAGIDTPQKMAEWDPVELREMLVKFVKQTGFDGIAPLPKELRNAVATAQSLLKIVEY